jgi:hypothetical protein
VAVGVLVGVRVFVGVLVFVGVFVGVSVHGWCGCGRSWYGGVNVCVGVNVVEVGVCVGVNVGVNVSVECARGCYVEVALIAAESANRPTTSGARESTAPLLRAKLLCCVVPTMMSTR